jgi:hypothetical protein
VSDSHESFFVVIDREASAHQLRYLVIGGYAVIAHGYPRLTFDFDLAIERAGKDRWLACVAGLGYRVIHDGGAFLQLTSEKHAWPLDLMLLNESTFARLYEGSHVRRLEGTEIRVPSVEHLIALKVHALAHSHAGRFLKDFEDVVNLVRRNKIELSAPEFREIFRRYGNEELYAKICRACAEPF